MTELSIPNGAYILIKPSQRRGLLMGMPQPNTETLSFLNNQDIGLVISLIEEEHYKHYKIPHAMNLRLVRFVMVEGQLPTETQMPRIALLCVLIHQFRIQGERFGVAIHCVTGQRRTGIVNAAYREYLHSIDPEDVDSEEINITIKQIERHLAHAQGISGLGPNIQQVIWLHKFKEFLKKNFNPIWYAWTCEELSWQKCSADMKPLWKCGICGQLATSKTSIWVGPIWCPRCGCATGNKPV